MYRRPFRYGYPRRRRGYAVTGCGCGGLGVSLLLSAIMTFLANLFLRRW